MSKKLDVARFHADYDIHTDHRIRLFAAIAELIEPVKVLYPGSYVDIAPSVFFGNVHYVDMDKRADRFFQQHDAVTRLVATKRAKIEQAPSDITIRFDHTDYREPLDIEDGSVDLLISLYAGFISEHCTRYLSPGGHLVVNNSHGDASMASLNPVYDLVDVINSRKGIYRAATTNLDTYLIPKKGQQPTVDSLHTAGRGIAYTKSPYLYIFKKVSISD